MARHARPRSNGVRSRRKTAEASSQAVTGATSRSPVTLWAYTYQIVPRQTRSELRAVSALLDREHAAAKDDAARFAGRLIACTQATRILIVSDRAERSCEVNQRLEAELRQLKADISVTAPVDVAATPESPSS
jgi:hypothetical protein